MNPTGWRARLQRCRDRTGIEGRRFAVTDIPVELIETRHLDEAHDFPVDLITCTGQIRGGARSPFVTLT